MLAGMDPNKFVLLPIECLAPWEAKAAVSCVYAGTLCLSP